MKKLSFIKRETAVNFPLLHWAALVLAVLIGTVHDVRAQAPDYEAIIAAPDRSDADRQTDKRRNPVKLLSFTGIRPGMKVLDLGAGAGYSTELDARAAAPNGVVYGQNPPDVRERAKDAFEGRLKTPAMKNVISVTQLYDDPVPAGVTDLDAITFFFAYHDVTFMPVDRAKMNKKLFDALKPGGWLIIADHSARAGEGTSVANTLHRIEEATEREELEAAGFKLVAEGDFLRHPEDARDFNVNRPTGPVDEFVLKFEKPR
jgi:predicted methyltransferase